MRLSERNRLSFLLCLTVSAILLPLAALPVFSENNIAANDTLEAPPKLSPTTISISVIGQFRFPLRGYQASINPLGEGVVFRIGDRGIAEKFKIADEEWKETILAVEKASFWEMKNEYGIPMPSIPVTVVTIHSGINAKTITVKDITFEKDEESRQQIESIREVIAKLRRFIPTKDLVDPPF